MKQEPEPGKRIVSKGEYARLIGEKAVSGVIGVTFILLTVAGLYTVRLMFMDGLHNLKSGVSLHSSWYLFTACVASYGFYQLLHDAKKKMAVALRKEPIVPLTRANAADLPAPDCLVRASQEPMQAQEGVLLRAASGETQAGAGRAVAQGGRRKAGVTNMVQTAQIGRKLARKRIRKTAEEAAYKPRLTGAQGAALLVQSGAFGAWAHRQDTQDSVAYARELRRQVETRERG